MSNADKITKLVTKLGDVDAKLFTLTQQRTTIVEEITALLTGEVVTATRTAMSKKNEPKLGERITASLRTTPGQTLQEISTALKTKAQKVSLAIYHLKNAGEVSDKDGRYFGVPNLAVTAAKSTPAEIELDEDDVEV